MRTREIVATIAVSGAVAAFALLNMNGVQMGQTFLSTPMTDAEREFINFISEHQRSYGTKEEYEYRLSLFTDVYNQVKNQDPNASYTIGINHLSDMSDYEYKRLLGYKPSMRQATGVQSFHISQADAVPASVDWRT
jgi:hypothetical protein